MTVVQHKDKSFDWLKWRKGGIGSSDAPIIMGVSEYKTPLQLWTEKTNPEIEEQETSYIQDKGNRAEVYARAKFCLEKCIDADPRLAQHEKHTYLLGSADLFDEETGTGAEFKLAGLDDHEGVRKGIVPQKYFPQVQHLMLVFGVKVWNYCSYYVPPGEKDLTKGELLILPVPADLDWMVHYLTHAAYFWNCVQTKTPPELTDRDAKLIKKKEVVSIAEQYLATMKELEEFTEARKYEVDALEKQIASIMEYAGTLQKQLGVLETALMKEGEQHARVMFGDTGVSVVQSWRKGVVDYATVPELLGVDLEQYRKPSTSSRKIVLEKKKKEKAKKK